MREKEEGEEVEQKPKEKLDKPKEKVRILLDGYKETQNAVRYELNEAREQLLLAFHVIGLFTEIF